MSTWRSTVLGFVLLSWPTAVVAQYVVEGHVRTELGVPAAGASVTALPVNKTVHTTADGTFRIELPQGEWDLRVEYVGYEQIVLHIQVPLAAPLDDVTLQEMPIPLASVEVVGRRREPFVHTATAGTIRNVPALAEPDIFRALILLPGVFATQRPARRLAPGRRSQ